MTSKNIRKKEPMPVTPWHVVAILVGASSYYVPVDVMKPSALRSSVRIGGVAAMIGLLTAASVRENAKQDDAAQNPGGDSRRDSEPMKKESPSADQQDKPPARSKAQQRLMAGALIAGAFGLIGLSAFTTVKLDNFVVGKLRKWGVPYPSTVWGTVNAGVGLAALLDERR